MIRNWMLRVAISPSEVRIEHGEDFLALSWLDELYALTTMKTPSPNLFWNFTHAHS
jgi:hypothetical protein